MGPFAISEIENKKMKHQEKTLMEPNINNISLYCCGHIGGHKATTSFNKLCHHYICIMKWQGTSQDIQ